MILWSDSIRDSKSYRLESGSCGRHEFDANNRTDDGGVHVSASKLSEAHGALGRFIYVTPTKMAGGVHAVDMSTGKTLAWLAYWNYGDTCAIAHHLSAFPSPDPYKGFELRNSRSTTL